MQMSRRAARMERHHKRSRSFMGLNMVSLMDIFTILVFFLLVNSTNVEVLPSAKSVKLPESVAEKLPKETIVVMVNDAEILVQGRPVAKVAEVSSSGSDVIASLKAELDYHAGRSAIRERDPRKQRQITIMGDKEIPYALLKKVMITCVRSNYDNISLAVIKKTPESNKSG